MMIKAIARWALRTLIPVLGIAFAQQANAAPCSATDCLGPGDYTLSMTWGGLPRSYTVHVPASYTGSNAVALTLDMHGHAGTADSQKTQSGQLAMSDQLGFIVVYPQGFLGAWNAYGCCSVGNDLNVDDVGFLRAVIGEMKRRANVDDRKVYVTGGSNGGGMAQRMACEAADVVTAAAPVSFPLNANSCHPARPVTVVEFAGTDDLVVPYYGYPPVLPRAVLGVPTGWQGARDSLAAWKIADGCSDTLTRVQLPAGSRDETYVTCAGGVKAGLVTMAGAGHVPYNGGDGQQLGLLPLNSVDIASYVWQHVFTP